MAMRNRVDPWTDEEAGMDPVYLARLYQSLATVHTMFCPTWRQVEAWVVSGLRQAGATPPTTGIKSWVGLRPIVGKYSKERPNQEEVAEIRRLLGWIKYLGESQIGRKILSGAWREDRRAGSNRHAWTDGPMPIFRKIPSPGRFCSWARKVRRASRALLSSVSNSWTPSVMSWESIARAASTGSHLKRPRKAALKWAKRHLQSVRNHRLPQEAAGALYKKEISRDTGLPYTGYGRIGHLLGISLSYDHRLDYLCFDITTGKCLGYVYQSKWEWAMEAASVSSREDSKTRLALLVIAEYLIDNASDNDVVLCIKRMLSRDTPWSNRIVTSALMRAISGDLKPSVGSADSKLWATYLREGESTYATWLDSRIVKILEGHSSLYPKKHPLSGWCCHVQELKVLEWAVYALEDPKRASALCKSRTVVLPGATIPQELSFVDHLDMFRSDDIESMSSGVNAVVQRANDRVKKEIDSLAGGPDGDRPLTDRKLPTAPNGMQWLVSMRDLVQEGKDMNHCVATHSWPVRNGKEVIARIRNKDGASTVAFDGKLKKVIQHYSYENKAPPNAHRRLVRNFLLAEKGHGL